ncbi:MAG TPA: hypothetical protein VF209_05420 [Patescibacteria group bacterium]
MKKLFTTPRLDKSQRKHLSSKLMDTANVILGTLVIAGFIDKKVGSLVLALALLSYILLVLYTLALAKKEK